MKKAIILLSGGLDSTTCLAIAKDMGFSLFALTIDYGQRHSFELQSAKKISGEFRVEHHSIINIDLSQFGGSALTDSIDVPKNRDESNIACYCFPILIALRLIFIIYVCVAISTLLEGNLVG